MEEIALITLLSFLREQALKQGQEKLGSHQLNAHWSIAFACKSPPEPWEIYRATSLHSMPETSFYKKYSAEIQRAMKEHASWELLRMHAEPKLLLESEMTKNDFKRHGFSGNTLYYDYEKKHWVKTSVQSIRWFDGREITREILNQSKEDVQSKSEKILQKHRDLAAKDPSEKRLQAVIDYENYMINVLPKRLSKFATEKSQAISWLKRLDATPDFCKAIFLIARQSENRVRKSMGIQPVGESWVSETELVYRVKNILPNFDVVHHGRPKWLGKQHFDIWLPELNVAIEYHGIQHFKAVDFFGGNETFQANQDRDQRKRELCLNNGVHLIEVAYDQDIDDMTLKSKILKQL